MVIYTEVNPYVPIGWAGSPTPAMTARAFTTMQNQYDPCSKNTIDMHTHDDSYYVQDVCETRYFYEGVTACDADLIDGKAYNQLVGGVLPVRICFAWNGTDSDVPQNWHIVDGSTVNGIALTPDSRGLYLMGAGNVHGAQTTGGASTISINGSVTVQSHLLTMSEIPNHYHNWIDTYGTGGTVVSEAGYNGCQTTNTTRVGTTDYNHADADQAHGADAVAVAFNTFNNTPLYFCKYLICKVA